jgi:uncharacterized protein (DUF362 family)
MNSKIIETIALEDLVYSFEEIGLNKQVKRGQKIAIKINLAKPPSVTNPRTDPTLIRFVTKYLHDRGCQIFLIESANGYLEDNIRAIGLEKELDSGIFEGVDLDNEEAEKMTAEDGEIHWFPKCLKDFDVRIAIPSTSLREGKVFSNNVKLFVGIVPRRYYQTSDQVGTWRAKIHENLHISIANIYILLNKYAKFDFYINGGHTYIKNQTIDKLPKYYISQSACDLDLRLINELGLEIPEYLLRLSTRLTG